MCSIYWNGLRMWGELWSISNGKTEMSHKSLYILSWDIGRILHHKNVGNKTEASFVYYAVLFQLQSLPLVSTWSIPFSISLFCFNFLLVKIYGDMELTQLSILFTFKSNRPCNAKKNYGNLQHSILCPISHGELWNFSCIFRRYISIHQVRDEFGAQSRDWRLLDAYFVRVGFGEFLG